MKLIILALGVIVALPALSQTQQKLIIGTWDEKSVREIPINPGANTVNVSDTTVALKFIFPKGTKTIVITVPTTAIVLDSISVDNLPTSGLVYSPTGWTHASNNPCCGWANNSLSYNSIVGSNFTYSFTGQKLTWWTEHAGNKGKVSVQMDSGPVKIINLTGNSGVDVVTKKPSYVWSGTSGRHVFKVTSLGGGDIANDRITYTFVK